MIFAAASASDPIDTFGTLAQAIAGLLSVPVVVTALTAIYRFLSPTARLSASVKRDADLFQALPASPQRDILEARIEQNLTLLNARYSAPASGSAALSPRAATMTGGMRWTGPVLVIVPVVLAVLLVVIGFVLVSGNFAAGKDATVLTIGIPALIGALGTIVFAIVESVVGSRSAKR